MGKKYSWFDASTCDISSWSGLCPENEYRVVHPGQLPAPLPTALTQQCNSSVLAASGTTSGGIIYVVNLYRVDKMDVDQDPFAIIFDSGNTATSGCLLHHSSHLGRTQQPPQEFWDAINESGVTANLPLQSLPVTSGGPLSALSGTPNMQAFEKVIDRLKKGLHEDGDGENE